MLRKFLISDQPPFPWKPEPVQIPYEDDSQNNTLPFHYDTTAKFIIPICGGGYYIYKKYSKCIYGNTVKIYVNRVINSIPFPCRYYNVIYIYNYMLYI